MFPSKRHVLGDPTEFIHTHYQKQTDSATLTNLFNRRVAEVTDYKDALLNKSQSNTSLENSSSNFVSNMRLIKNKNVADLLE